MFWTEENEQKQQFQVPDDVVDMAYRLDCRMLPLDHAHALSTALQQALPWLGDEPQAAVHLIHVAESGNGWYRPQDPQNEVLNLSRRTRMTLRVPRHRIDDARELAGTTLDIDGYELNIQQGEVKLFNPLPTLFARYVITEADQDEEAFLQANAEQLQRMGIPVKKMMAGKPNIINMPQGKVHTRSLMVADLKPEDSIRLQQEGVGEGQKFGCGIFIPQKGIKAVQPDGQ